IAHFQLPIADLVKQYNTDDESEKSAIGNWQSAMIRGTQARMSSVISNIESVLQEERIFPPPPEFSEQAHIKSMEELESLRAEADANPEAFWARMAEELHWFRKWDTVLKWDPPHAEWFGGGRINISYNCLDRHLSTWRRNKAALIWEGEPGDTRTFTYQQLHT